MNSAFENNNQHMVFVDAHVHIHDCFCMTSFFDAAVKNFQQASLSTGYTQGRQSFILLLTESAGKNHYNKLGELAEKRQTLAGKNGLKWRLELTSELCTLKAVRADGQSFFLVAGRQVITSENLEVLALITSSLFEEKQPLFQTVQEVRESGSIPVIPWGFGKWIGKRGRILEQFLIKNDKPVFLGDNGGRPCFRPRPRLFSVVEAGGGRVLPGSDPLPLPVEASRVGSFGFTMNTVLSSHVARDLKKCLEDPTISLSAYGAPQKIMPFFKNQLLIRTSIRF
jgi:hypothetical protein